MSKAPRPALPRLSVVRQRPQNGARRTGSVGGRPPVVTVTGLCPGSRSIVVAWAPGTVRLSASTRICCDTGLPGDFADPWRPSRAAIATGTGTPRSPLSAGPYPFPALRTPRRSQHPASTRQHLRLAILLPQRHTQVRRPRVRGNVRAAPASSSAWSSRSPHWWRSARPVRCGGLTPRRLGRPRSRRIRSPPGRDDVRHPARRALLLG